MTIIEAIAHQEGFFVQGSRAQRNHNPGNIVWGTFAKFHGAIGEDTTGVPKGAGFAVFPDDETGWRALGSLLATPVYRSLTVQQAIYRYAPPSENQTGVYIQNVCAMTGLQPDDPISKGLT